MFSLSTISSTFGSILTGITHTFTKSVQNSSDPIVYDESINPNLEAFDDDQWIVLYPTENNEVFEYVTIFDDKCEPIIVTTFDENDELMSLTIFDENGEPITTVTTFNENCKPTTVTTFFENGTPMTAM